MRHFTDVGSFRTSCSSILQRLASRVLPPPGRPLCLEEALMSKRFANPALFVIVTAVGLCLTFLVPLVAHAQPFSISLQVGTGACAAGACDNKISDTGVVQLKAASEFFRSEVQIFQQSLQDAVAVADGNVTLGTLSASLAASATGSGTNSASATVDATWRDSFIAVGPPGALLTYHVTFVPSASHGLGF